MIRGFERVIQAIADTKQYAYVPVGSPGALQLQQESGPPRNLPTYDALGNLTSNGTRTFSWEAESGLVGIAYSFDRCRPTPIALAKSR